MPKARVRDVSHGPDVPSLFRDQFHQVSLQMNEPPSFSMVLDDPGLVSGSFSRPSFRSILFAIAFTCFGLTFGNLKMYALKV